MRTWAVFTTVIGLLLAIPVIGDAGGFPPLAYSAKSIQGTVVDAATGRPLAGVIVVAQWVLYESIDYGRHLQEMEAVTDSAGVYRFSAWGPKPNPGFPFARLDAMDPHLSLFLPGFKPGFAVNRWESNEALRASEWDGKTIQLQAFSGTAEQWAGELRSLQTSLSWGDRMDWRCLPRMTLALERERVKLVGTPVDKRGMNLRDLEDLSTTPEEVQRYLEAQK
jgi:hypothetical protein